MVSLSDVGLDGAPSVSTGIWGIGRRWQHGMAYHAQEPGVVIVEEEPSTMSDDRSQIDPTALVLRSCQQSNHCPNTTKLTTLSG